MSAIMRGLIAITSDNISLDLLAFSVPTMLPLRSFLQFCERLRIIPAQVLQRAQVFAEVGLGPRRAAQSYEMRLFAVQLLNARRDPKEYLLSP
jgi:hypothetical protein